MGWVQRRTASTRTEVHRKRMVPKGREWIPHTEKGQSEGKVQLPVPNQNLEIIRQRPITDQTSYQAPERPLSVTMEGAVSSGLVHQSSHRFIDPLHKHSQEEDCSNGRSEAARPRLDGLKQLTALSCLDDGEPADADGNDAQNPDSGHGRRQQRDGD